MIQESAGKNGQDLVMKSEDSSQQSQSPPTLEGGHATASADEFDQPIAGRTSFLPILPAMHQGNSFEAAS